MDKKNHLAMFVQKNDGKLLSKSAFAFFGGWIALLLAGGLFTAAFEYSEKRHLGDVFDVFGTEKQIENLVDKGGVELWNNDEVNIKSKD